MEVVVLQPDDIKFPLGKEIWEDKNVWFHGTSSIFIEKIESTGWKSGDLPYSLSDVGRVIEIYDSIRERGTLQDFPAYSDSILYSYTMEGNLVEFEKRGVSLTRNYWLARNYSRNIGGETINAILEACKFFVRLVRDPFSHGEHIKRLDKEIEDFHKHYSSKLIARVESLTMQLKRMERRRSNFINTVFLERELGSIEEINRKYERIVKESFPVVYAIEYKTDYTVNKIEREDPYSESWKILPEYRETENYIPPEKIIARIEFKDGITHYRDFNVVGNWRKDHLLPWI